MIGKLAEGFGRDPLACGIGIMGKGGIFVIELLGIAAQPPFRAVRSKRRIAIEHGSMPSAGPRARARACAVLLLTLVS